jgi:choline dehydrogenase-like flavoprotein
MDTGPLTTGEFHTLARICDTLLPPGDSPWRASVAERGAALLKGLPNADDLAQLRRLLRLLEMPVASLALTGQAKRLSAMSPVERENALRALARHPLSQIRGAFQALKRLAMVLYYADCDAEGHNPAWPPLNYPGPIAAPPNVPKTIRPLAVEDGATLGCDVVIVGSGVGGGIVADELTAAGYDVIVLEKGGYYNESDFNQREFEALQKLCLDGGLSASRDQGVVILAGSCLGGGTVINYTTSLRTPDPVRAEWARLTGLDVFVKDEFTRSLDAVCERLHVNQEHNRPSRRDELMARGLTVCGWHVDRMPRNVDGCTQDDVCGYCGFGCVRGAKCSTLKTCLQDAFERGARIVVHCAAERVLVENGRAVGVVARTQAGHPVTVHARVVVVAAGAIHSPALLLRSGLSRPVGDYLRLHPVTAVWGTFAEAVRPWTGTLQALYSEQFADLDEGYGVRFETTAIHPLFLAFGAAWESAVQFDATMRRLIYTSPVGILLRDRFGGRVTLNRSGVPVIRYRIATYDQHHVRRGVEGAARVLLAAGAQEIFSTQNRFVAFRPGGRETLEDWLERVDRVGYGANQTIYISFHQMGTCRMGSDRATSVVNGRGETHAVKHLYVADASLFPSASGVNPMITIAALAHYVAQQIKASLA